MATHGNTPIQLSAGQLEPVVREETARCTQLGIQLHIPFPRLQVLEKQSNDKKPTIDCFTEMCQQWFKDKTDRKWSEVYKALEQQGNRRLRAILEEKYRPETTVQLEFKDFIKQLREMTPSWYMFGIALGLSVTDLNIIEDKGGSRRYMLAMLNEWMKTKPNDVTWENLQEALRAIGNKRLAANLEKRRIS